MLAHWIRKIQNSPNGLLPIRKIGQINWDVKITREREKERVIAKKDGKTERQQSKDRKTKRKRDKYSK